MMQDLVGIVRREDEMQRAIADSPNYGSERAGSSFMATANTIPAGTPRWT
jgi:hypothetical protein